MLEQANHPQTNRRLLAYYALGAVALGVLISALPPLAVMWTVGGTALAVASLRMPVLAVYSVLFALPFRVTLVAAGPVDLRPVDVVGLIAVLAALWVSVSARPEGEGFSWRDAVREWRPFLAFFVWGVLATGVSWVRLGQIDAESVAEVLRLSTSFAIAIAVSMLITSRAELVKALTFLGFGAAITCVMSLSEFRELGLGLLATSREVTAATFWAVKFGSSPMFRDPNNYASYLLIVLFAACARWYAAISRQERWTSIWCIITIGLVGAVLVVTFSRSAWIGACVALALLYVKSPVASWRYYILAGIAFTAIVMITFFRGIFDTFILRITEDFSAVARIELMRAGFVSTIKNPVFGLGLGNFAVTWKDVLWNPSTHNLFLKVSSETGVPGLILFIAALIRLVSPAFGKPVATSGLIALGILAVVVQSIAVEYLSAKHFWIAAALVLAAARLEAFGPDPAFHEEQEAAP